MSIEIVFFKHKYVSLLAFFLEFSSLSSSYYYSFECHDGEATVKVAPVALIWVWLASVLLMRVGVLVIGTGLLFIRHESLRLTIPAKVSTII